MKFLVLLLILVIIFKLYSIYQLYEDFDNNCIKDVIPNFNDASGTSLYTELKYLYDTKDKDIETKIITWENNDIYNNSKIIQDISNFAMDPLDEEYPYYDKINCKMNYVTY